MRKLVVMVIALAGCCSVTGCGGCTDSETAMRRNARVRFPDELESAPTPAAAAQRAAQPPSPSSGAEAAVAKSPTTTPRKAAAGKVEAAGAGSPSTGKADVQQVKAKEIPALVAFAPEPPPPETSPVTKVVENARPPELLNPREVRSRTIKNLTRIGKAINEYIAKYGTFPPRAIRNDSGDFGLSWRVAILPQLGYERLYSQFRLYESWDSPHNRQLLEQIPPEFQSPERFETTTNYLAVAAPESVFLQAEPIAPGAIWDGLANTIIVVEADDTHAVEWSRPADLVPTYSDPGKGLGTLRGDGFLSLMADGKVLRVPPTVKGTALISFFTFQGEESTSAAVALKAPTLVPPTIANALAVDAAGGEASATTESGTTVAAPPPTVQSLQELAPAGPPPVPKLVMPDEIALAKARELFKDLYDDRVKEAAKTEDRVKLVREMLADASGMEANAADYYELLRIVRDIAGGCGDVATALQAIELLEAKFEIDGLEMRLKSLDELIKFLQKPEVAKALPDMAKDILALCIDRDDYDSAQKVGEQVLAMARAARNAGDVQRATQTLSWLGAARTAYNHVPLALKRLEIDPKDAPANETIGKYLCLIKGRWRSGLPYLMKGDDLKLRVIASIDMLPERKLTETASLADQYWDMADDFKQPQKRNLKLRAAFWYKVAVQQLSDGLEKSRAKRRIEDVELAYGKFEVDRAITRMISDANLTAVIGAPKDPSE